MERASPLLAIDLAPVRFQQCRGQDRLILQAQLPIAPIFRGTTARRCHLVQRQARRCHCRVATAASERPTGSVYSVLSQPAPQTARASLLARSSDSLWEDAGTRSTLQPRRWWRHHPVKTGCSMIPRQHQALPQDGLVILLPSPFHLHFSAQTISGDLREFPDHVAYGDTQAPAVQFDGKRAPLPNLLLAA